jgi:hypothetical protein
VDLVSAIENTNTLDALVVNDLALF